MSQLNKAIIWTFSARSGRREASFKATRPARRGAARVALTAASIAAPTPSENSVPNSIVTGSDGNLWFTEFNGNKIGMINPTTHAITEFTPPAAKSNYAGLGGIAAGPDGNLWFTEDNIDANISNIGMINSDHPRHRRVPHADPECQSQLDHGGARRQPLVHRVR